MADVPVEVKKTSPAPAPGATPDTWRSFRTEMDRLFDRFADGFSWPSFGRMFDLELPRRDEGWFGFTAPPIEIGEDDKAYKITAELPGLDAKDVEVTISGDTLVLKGEKRQGKEERGKNTYMSERSYGAFRRSFLLPESVDRGKLAADFSKGVLTITLPKSAKGEKAAKRIEVKAA
ncbi:MAG TPA: Hsp20/alpha crystallin family protein [Stellaceae bacterium]|nr:Hsp20/alpha crystallin family protein [Stellaceae bacterium]